MEKEEEVGNTQTQFENVTPVAQLVASGVEQDEEEKEKQQQELEFIAACSHQKLNQKIYRLRTQINSSISLKLPDKGEKLRRSLKLLEDEQERRNQLQRQKEAECAAATIHQIIHELAGSTQEAESQSRSSYSHGECNALCADPPPNQVPSQSQAAFLYKNVEDKAGPQEAVCENSKQSQCSCSHGACNEFSSEAPSSQALSRSKSTSQKLGEEELPSSVGCSNHPYTKTNGLLRGRCGTNTWRRNSSRSFSRDGDEQRSPTGAQNDIGSSRFYPPRQNGRFSNHLFRRPRQPEMRIPNLHSLQIQSILQSILQSSSTSESQTQSPITYQVNTGGPSEAQMAELLSSIHVMQQQFQTVQNKLASLESQVTTRTDRLETKVEQIIRVQSGEKSTKASTPEEPCADS